MPGSLPAASVPTDAPVTALALLSFGPVPPAQKEETPTDDAEEDPTLNQAQLRCHRSEVAEVRRIHRGLADLHYQLTEDAVYPPPEPEDGAPVDSAVARKQEITRAFFAECVADVRKVLVPLTVAAGDSGDETLDMSLQTVSTLCSLMDTSAGGKYTIDEAICRMLRAR